MTKPNLPTRPDPTQFANHVDALRSRLRVLTERITLENLAAHTGAVLQGDQTDGWCFSLHFWQQAVTASLPDWQFSTASTGQPLSPPNQALLLFYFLTADGRSEALRWVSFADLPDGRFYNQAFQGYTGAELARFFQNDSDRLKSMAARSGGQLLPSDPNIPGELAYRFQVLPRLSVLLAYWQGDEDFPASIQVLFESITPHYLPTDVCAYLGSSLTRLLTKP